MAIAGYLKLKEPMLCKEDVFGKRFKTIIDGIEAQICFPNLPKIDADNPDIGITNPLISPDKLYDWNNAEWGYPKSYPSITGEVYAVVILLDQKSSNDDAKKLYLSFSEWIKKASDMCVLLHPNIKYRDKNLLREEAFVQFFNDREYIPNDKAITLYAYMYLLV